MSLKKLEVHFDTTANSASSRRVFWAESNDINDDPEKILADPLCPKQGQRDPYNPAKIISDVTAEHRPKTTKSVFWTITYTSEIQQQSFTNPLGERAEITLDSETIETYTCFDKKNRAILNAAGDLVYIPIDDTRWIFNVSKNMERVPIELLQFNNAINDSMVTVGGLPCEKETLAVKNLRVSSIQEAQGFGGIIIEYVTVSFQLHYRRETWIMTYPNVGFNAIFETPNYDMPKNFDGSPKYDYVNMDGEAGKVTNGAQPKGFNGKRIKLRKIKEKRAIEIGGTRKPPTEPQVLDKDGKWLPDAKPSDVIKLKAEVYQTRNFSALPLR